MTDIDEIAAKVAALYESWGAGVLGATQRIDDVYFLLGRQRQRR